MIHILLNLELFTFEISSSSHTLALFQRQKRVLSSNSQLYKQATQSSSITIINLSQTSSPSFSTILRYYARFSTSYTTLKASFYKLIVAISRAIVVRIRKSYRQYRSFRSSLVSLLRSSFISSIEVKTIPTLRSKFRSRAYLLHSSLSIIRSISLIVLSITSTSISSRKNISKN